MFKKLEHINDLWVGCRIKYGQNSNYCLIVSKVNGHNEYGEYRIRYLETPGASCSGGVVGRTTDCYVEVKPDV